MEPMTGIEPAYSAWEAFSMAERVIDNRWSAGCRQRVFALVRCTPGTPAGRHRFGPGAGAVRAGSGVRPGYEVDVEGICQRAVVECGRSERVTGVW